MAEAANPAGTDPPQEESATSIWPPTDGAPSDAPPVEDIFPTAAQQFPALDPQLLSASIEATTAAPESLVPTRRDLFGALWRNWLSSRYPVFAAALLLLLISLPRTVDSVVDVTSARPFLGTFAVVLWVLYAVPLILLIIRVDFFEREPNALIAAALVWGGVIATSMAVPANQAAYSILTSLFGEAFTVRWGATLAAPLTEETLKAIGIVAVILLARRALRSSIDGFVVGAMVGLGFQVVENFVYTGNLLLASDPQQEPLQSVLSVFLVRGIGSGLWSHAVYSGVAGMGIAYALVRRDRPLTRRVMAALVMLGLGWLLHLIWNIPVPEGLTPIAVVVKAAIILSLLGAVVLRNQGHESYIYTDYLESVHDPSVVTESEIEDLRTYRSREAAARRAAVTGGDRSADAVRRLQRRQADLSVALANGDIERMAQARRGIAAARAQMTAAALLPDEVGHRWGVWSIWMSVIGVLIPIVGPLIAAVLAAVGTRDAQRAGAELAGSVRAAWVLSAVSLLAGFVVVYLLIG